MAMMLRWGMFAASQAAMLSSVGRTRGESRSGGMAANCASSLAPVASRRFPSSAASASAAYFALSKTRQFSGSGLAGRSRRRYSTPAFSAAALMFLVASTA